MTNYEKWIGSLKTVDDFVNFFRNENGKKYIYLYCDKCPAKKEGCIREDCEDHFTKWGNEINLDVSDKKIQELIDSINDFEPLDDTLDALQYAFEIKKELELRTVEKKLTPLEYLMQENDIKTGEHFNVQRVSDGFIFETDFWFNDDGTLKCKRREDKTVTDNTHTIGQIIIGKYKIVKKPPMTKEQAYQEIIKIIAEFNGDWKPDWGNNKGKYYLQYTFNKFDVDFTTGLRFLPNELYLKSEPSNELLEKLEPLYKIYLGLI